MDDVTAVVASGYDAFYSSWGTSPTLRPIWREKVTRDFSDQFVHISLFGWRERHAALPLKFFHPDNQR